MKDQIAYRGTETQPRLQERTRKGRRRKVAQGKGPIPRRHTGDQGSSQVPWVTTSTNARVKWEKRASSNHKCLVSTQRTQKFYCRL